MRDKIVKKYVSDKGSPYDFMTQKYFANYRRFTVSWVTVTVSWVTQ